MNDPMDVVRSLRRYVWLMLGTEPASGKPWTVRLGRVEVADDDRPVAVVEAAGPLTTPHSRAATMAQGDQQKAQTFAVVAYPSVGATGPEANVAAGEVASLLDAGFGRGLVTDDAPPVSIGAPWRVPIYDFAGVPVRGAGRAGGTVAYGYAAVASTFNVRAIADAVDNHRYVVTASVPLSWWQGGRKDPDGPIATSMLGAFGAVAP